MARASLGSIQSADSLAQQAYERIRAAIRKGSISHAELYSEAELGAEMGISRTPVREALLELASEGLIEIVPRRGFMLRELDSDERDEVFALRALLETFAVERLAETITAADVAELAAIVERQRAAARRPDAFLTLDEQFHLLIPRLARLERTERALRSLRGAMWLIGSSAILLGDRVQSVLREHTRIVSALRSRDPEKAVEAVRIHLLATAVSLAEKPEQGAGHPGAAASRARSTGGTPRRANSRTQVV